MRDIDPGKLRRPDNLDPGPAPMLQWLRVEDLVIDDSYQRELKPKDWTAIRRIAAGFRWSRFSPLLVAPLAGGKFAIIDGQHRTHAAAACGFSEVPAQIVQMSHSEQAASFAAVNGAVTAITVWQIYKAALAAGEDWAVEADAICTRAGCRLMTYYVSHLDRKAGQIFSVGLIRKAVRTGRGDILETALKAFRNCEMAQEDGVWGDRLLEPWVLACLERTHLAGHDLSPVLDAFDPYEAQDEADNEIRKARRSGTKPRPRRQMIVEYIGSAIDRLVPEAGKADAEAAE